jgi:hypothetical protein
VLLRVVAALVTWQTLFAGLIWFVIGLMVSWNRRLGMSVVVPLLVVVLPSIAMLISGVDVTGRAQTASPQGSAALVAVMASAFVGSILGGHVAVATNPTLRTARAARVAGTLAHRRALALEAQICEMEQEITGGSRPDAVPALVVAQAQQPVVDLFVFRARLDAKRTELRELRRQGSARVA